MELTSNTFAMEQEAKRLDAARGLLNLGRITVAEWRLIQAMSNNSLSRVEKRRVVQSVFKDVRAQHIEEKSLDVRIRTRATAALQLK